MPKLQASQSESTRDRLLINFPNRLLILEWQCDETRPKCDKCRAYGVTCIYGVGPVEHLDTGRELISAASKDLTSRITPIHTSLTMLNIRYTSQTRGLLDQPAVSWSIDEFALQRLNQFQNVTVLTMGTTKIAKVYQSEIVKLAVLVGFWAIIPNSSR